MAPAGDCPRALSSFPMHSPSAKSSLPAARDMINHRPKLYLILFGFLLFPLLACNVAWPEYTGPMRGERPVATSTPVATPHTSKPDARLLMVAPPAQSEATGGTTVGAAEMHTLSTEEQLARVITPARDLRDLALRLNPDVDEIPAVVNAAPPHYAIGDTQTFWIHDLGANNNSQITAELIYETDVAYVWLEEGRDIDREVMFAAVDRFSKESYPAETAFFGSEWNPGVDNDPRIHILHAYGLGEGIAGYYSSADEYARLARDFSNEKEMFYINLGWLNSSRDYEYYETVLAHEFQHMIHWNQDRNEETWVNEGLSEFAQEVAGYPPDTVFAEVFTGSPDTQLNTWGEVQGNNGIHYGASYLFMTYFAQRFGPEMMRAVVSHPANGIRGFDAVLAAAGLGTEDGVGFAGVFADWVVANYVNDANALGGDGVYGYRELDQGPPRVEAIYTAYPTQAVTATVANYATDYVLLKGRGDVTVDFEGQHTTRLADVQAHSGDYAWFSNRGDELDTRLTRAFDLRELAPGTPVMMDAAMWWDIEDDYDYGYVLVSQDGRKWTPVIGDHTDADAAGDNAFGPAYTAQSGVGDRSTWVIEQFDLSPWAGEEIYVRFEYVTDDAVNLDGWFVDDIRIPALGYAADFENGNDGWESEGWLLTDNRLNQDWLVQLLTFEDKLLSGVERIPVDAGGRAQIEVDNLGNGRTAVLAISALAPVTTEAANYSYRIDERP